VVISVIDVIIQHCEKYADLYAKLANEFSHTPAVEFWGERDKENRRLAEWLKLKQKQGEIPNH